MTMRSVHESGCGHHLNIAGEAICPELDEKRKCFARTHIKAAAPAASAPAALRC
jgi:hypothetical protein